MPTPSHGGIDPAAPLRQGAREPNFGDMVPSWRRRGPHVGGGPSSVGRRISYRSMQSIREIDLFPADEIFDLHAIASRMAAAKYGRECVQVYAFVCKPAVDAALAVWRPLRLASGALWLLAMAMAGPPSPCSVTWQGHHRLVANVSVGRWPGPRDPQRPWSNKLLGESPTRLLASGRWQ